MVRIAYFGDTEPNVVVLEPPGEPTIDIEFVDGEEERWLLMEHKGIRIYHTTRHQDMFSDYYYSTERGRDSDDSEPEVFDVSDLAPIPVEEAGNYADLFPDNDDKRLIAYAIDQGKIDEGGLVDES